MTAPRAFASHFEVEAAVAAPPEGVFALLDDHARLAAHMTRRTWMMAGSRMAIDVDERGGHAAGSKIRLHGRILGIALGVEEVVTEREPPYTKAWQTTGSPRLLVVGPYRMGFRLAPRGDGSQLVVFIDYDATAGPLSHVYARWCTRRMARDAAAHFAQVGDGKSVTSSGPR